MSRYGGTLRIPRNVPTFETFVDPPWPNRQTYRRATSKATLTATEIATTCTQAITAIAVSSIAIVVVVVKIGRAHV